MSLCGIQQKGLGMLNVQAEEQGDIVVLRLKGHIVRGPETATLRDAVVSQDKASIIALDLSQVDLLDAGGLGMLLELRYWAHVNGIRFRLANPTKPIQQVFAITHLDSVFDISFPEDVRSRGAPEAVSAIVSASPQYASLRDDYW
jgi:anti-anti-sigma factor